MQKIKTSLLSYGMSGKVFHAPFIYSHQGFELLGAWERSKKLLQNDYPLVKSYATLDDLLQDDCELVIVNTPTSTHFDYAKKALLAGKHVLVEKAFTTTVAEAEELDLLAKSLQLHLIVFQNRRWDSDFKTVQEVLSKKLLGDLIEGEIHFDRFTPLLSPKMHKETPNNGAGVLKDLGPHIIDQSLCLFGMPTAVFADIRITREASLVDDYFDILLYYASFRIRLKAGYFVREANPAYVFHGKKGSFLKARGDVQEDILKLGKKPTNKTWGREPKKLQGILHTEINGKIIREKIPSQQGNYRDFFEAVYQAIRNKAKVPVSANEGSNVIRIIEASLESNRQQKVVKL